MENSAFKAAVVQAGSVLFDTPATLEKLRDLTADCARQQASLIVFPEAFVGGYPKGLDFGARLGSRTPEGRDDFRRYFESAITVPGPETEMMGEAARAAGAHIVVGVIERAASTLYCTSLTFGADGTLLGHHRKLMPTALERVVWGMGDGSTISVVDTPLGKIGSAICWENYMPLLRVAMYAKGVELYCVPTVDDRDTWLSTMRMIALEGRCFMFSACQYLTRADYPSGHAIHQEGKPDDVLIRGGSCIVSPLGEILAAPDFSGERIAIADIDPSERVRGKFDLDVVGHYARPDIFHLSVNENPMPNVTLSKETLHGNVHHNE